MPSGQRRLYGVERVDPPAPTVLSGAGPSGKVLPTSRFLIVVRCRVGGGGRVCPSSADTARSAGRARQSRRRAARRPAMPKKGAGNDPAPLIDTPSIAAMSGFMPPVERRAAAAEELRASDSRCRGTTRRARAENAPRGGRRRRADRADRDDAHRRTAGIALRRDAARRGVVVVPLVPRRREQRRSRRRRTPAGTRRCSDASAARRPARSARRCGSRSWPRRALT